MPVTTFATMNGRILAHKTGVNRLVKYLPDALGSVTCAVSGGTVQTTSYTPYGQGTKPPLAKFGWVGSWGYRPTGLAMPSHYVRSRHYDDVTGSWTSVDGLWPAERQYCYVLGTPLTLSDFDGRQAMIGHDRKLPPVISDYYAGFPKCVCATGNPHARPKSADPSTQFCLDAACRSYCAGVQDPTETAKAECNSIWKCRSENDVFQPCTSGVNWLICGQYFIRGLGKVQDWFGRDVGANKSHYPKPVNQYPYTDAGGEFCCVECKIRVCCHFADLNDLFLDRLHMRMRRCFRKSVRT